MSDHLPSSSYADCFGAAAKEIWIDTKSYEYQFRVLVMQVFMDRLSLEQIESFFFVYKLPQRLRDHGRERLRSEVLTYIDEQLLDKWRKTPSALQNVLEVLGRPGLSAKVQELVESCPAATVCQETAPGPGSSPQHNFAGGKQQKQAPVQEMQQFSQMPHYANYELHRDCAGEDRSSTGGEAHRKAQPQAASSHNTLQSSRHNMVRMDMKQLGELDNILEESLSQEDDKHDSGSLKRSASTVSHDSIRSSGYFSNPRFSDLRISQVSIGESIAENDLEEPDGTLLGSIKQAQGDNAEDEGVVMKIGHTSEFLESYETTGAEMSSSNALSPSHSQAPNKNEGVAASKDQDGLLEPVSRPRLFQVSYSPSHKIRQLKQTDGDLLPEHTEIRKRSRSLPTTSRIELLRNNALPPSIHLHYPPSNSSSTSLDSDTTFGSPSEQSSMTGSQLSIASTISGHDSKPNSLSRHMSPPNQKPLPVVSEIMFSGSMKIKVKDILKSIERNSQSPVTSDEFPRVKGHHGPRYEMRFFPSNFGKGNSSLYIDVARSYLHKKAKNKERCKPIEIPAMNITVHFSYGGDTSSEGGRRHEIKSEMLETDVKIIDCQGEASKRCVVASFPQLVSHSELGLSDTLTDGRLSLIIRVNMNVRS